MKQSRLDALADGIFAIVMTILVFDIRVPDLVNPTNGELIMALYSIYPLFLSFLLSFSLLFTYWRAHHYIVSVYAQGVDVKLTNINAVFFFFVALVPFSSYFLGKYSSHQISIIVFALNVIFIGVSLYVMRNYVDNSKNIDHQKISKNEDRHAYMRILFPVFCAYGAMILSFVNNQIALFFFTLGILYNLLPNSTRATFKILDSFK